jgi:tRNA uridine 5-carbamoylmethylation protein Kti12
MEQITKYFNAEKYESLLFILVGVVTISFATYFLIKLKRPFYNGIAYPLIAIALIQLTVGCSVYFRSPKDIERVIEIIQSNKTKIQTEEISRMEDKWWAPKPYQSRTKLMNFVEDGQKLYDMVGQAGEEHWGLTKYERVNPKSFYSGFDYFCDKDVVSSS